MTSGADCDWAAACIIGVWARGKGTRAIQDPADAAKFAALVIRRHLPDPAYRIFLFGSRATGSAAERSDIDIGIEGPAAVPHAALAAIHDELEEAPERGDGVEQSATIADRGDAELPQIIGGEPA